MAVSQNADRRVNVDEFEAWCERQAENSRSPDARFIVRGAEDNDLQGEQFWRFWLRVGEREGGVESIELVRSQDTDVIRFKYDGESRQFHLHRRQVEFHEKTLRVLDDDGNVICSAGAGTRKRRGPFPL